MIFFQRGADIPHDIPPQLTALIEARSLLSERFSCGRIARHLVGSRAAARDGTAAIRFRPVLLRAMCRRVKLTLPPARSKWRGSVVSTVGGRLRLKCYAKAVF